MQGEICWAWAWTITFKKSLRKLSNQSVFFSIHVLWERFVLCNCSGRACSASTTIKVAVYLSVELALHKSPVARAGARRAAPLRKCPQLGRSRPRLDLHCYIIYVEQARPLQLKNRVQLTFAEASLSDVRFPFPFIQAEDSHTGFDFDNVFIQLYNYLNKGGLASPAQSFETSAKVKILGSSPEASPPLA